MHQRVVTLAGFHDDVATVSAVAAGGTAAGHKLLAPEGHATVAAAAGLDSNFGFVNEHGKAALRSWPLAFRETLIKSGFSKGTAFRPSVSTLKSLRLQPLRELL